MLFTDLFFSFFPLRLQCSRTTQYDFNQPAAQPSPEGIWRLSPGIVPPSIEGDRRSPTKKETKVELELVFLHSCAARTGKDTSTVVGVVPCVCRYVTEDTFVQSHPVTLPRRCCWCRRDAVVCYCWWSMKCNFIMFLTNCTTSTASVLTTQSPAPFPRKVGPTKFYTVAFYTSNAAWNRVGWGRGIPHDCEAKGLAWERFSGCDLNTWRDVIWKWE